MKTAISLPHDVFERATRAASRLGISRSELFATSVTRYLDEADRASLTRSIDAALDAIGDDDSNAVAALAGRRTLLDTDEDW